MVPVTAPILGWVIVASILTAQPARVMVQSFGEVGQQNVIAQQPRQAPQIVPTISQISISAIAEVVSW